MLINAWNAVAMGWQVGCASVCLGVPDHWCLMVAVSALDHVPMACCSLASMHAFCLHNINREVCFCIASYCHVKLMVHCYTFAVMSTHALLGTVGPKHGLAFLQPSITSFPWEPTHTLNGKKQSGAPCHSWSASVCIKYFCLTALPTHVMALTASATAFVYMTWTPQFSGLKTGWLVDVETVNAIWGVVAETPALCSRLATQVRPYHFVGLTTVLLATCPPPVVEAPHSVHVSSKACTQTRTQVH